MNLNRALTYRKRKLTLTANVPVFLNGLDFDAGDNPVYASGEKGVLVERKGLWLSRVLGSSSSANVHIGISTLLNTVGASDYTQALFNEDYSGVSLASGLMRSPEFQASEKLEVTIMSDVNCDVIVSEWA